MAIQRIAESIVGQMLTTPKVLLVIGARQVGKTTLIEHMCHGPGHAWLNLDWEPDRARLVNAGHLMPADALRQLGRPSVLVIDEAQRLPEVGRIVKGWFDAHLPVKIVLLGSSSVNLLDASAEALTGRNQKLYLPQLLFQEIIEAQLWYSPVFDREALARGFANQIESLLLTTMAYGSYPEAVTSSDKEGYLLNLISDYLLKDVLQIAILRSPETLRRLLLLLAHQVGSLVSVSELATALGVARGTVEKYLDLLERVFVIFRLPAFSGNLRKEITKSHKVYFWDTGVRNALLRNLSDSAFRGDIGKLWENWVIAEFAKRNLLFGQRSDLFFWRTADGSEVDLVIRRGESLKAYEIKWAQGRSSGARAFANRYGVDVQMITKENFLFALE